MVAKAGAAIAPTPWAALIPSIIPAKPHQQVIAMTSELLLLSPTVVKLPSATAKRDPSPTMRSELTVVQAAGEQSEAAVRCCTCVLQDAARCMGSCLTTPPIPVASCTGPRSWGMARSSRVEGELPERFRHDAEECH
jgi:hypothetical protein